jgi:Uma2 family endonuclease
MPESVPHDQAVELLKALLSWWAARFGAGPDAPFVVRNLAVRWDGARPKVGLDPDIAVLRPPPPNAHDLRSLRTWLPGHVAPLLAIEVVSETNPHKDYVEAPDKYCASGTTELWIFDPLLSGPRVRGGPFRLQVWHRREDGDFVRIYAGAGPVKSPSLDAWLVPTDEGRKLRICDDEEATRFWLTPEEAERAAKEAERAAKGAVVAERDAAIEARDAAALRIAELEAKLAASK